MGGLSIEEKVGSLFQPDVLLPSQYFETIKRNAYLEPEKRLILAVLEETVTDFQKYIYARDSKGRQKFNEAEKYILGRSVDWLFSFENVCEVLELSPSYLRDGLMRWKESKLKESHKTYQHS